MKIIRSINIEQNIWNVLDKIAKEENRTKSNMIEKLIMDYNKK